MKASALAAGIGLLEGCRRPEERFLVQPARRPPGSPLPGASVWEPGVCRQCSAGCGIQVRVVDGNAVKIEGAPEHPVNEGGVCAIGHSSLQELYNPDRILTPMRRSGGRGEGSFEATTWEAALADVVEALSSARPEGIVFVGADRDGFTGALWRRLAAALGAPPPAFVEPLELEVERRAANIALGVDELPYFDVGRADYVLSIGAAFLDRWRSPVHYTKAFSRLRGGTPGRRGKLVHAEARMSLTAANADEWLPVRPGSEGALARAMAGHMIGDGLVDAAAATRYAGIFADDPPSLDEAAAACDVPARRIATVAAELAAADHPVVLAGGSAAAHANGLYNVVAGLALNVLLDNPGQPGGVFAAAGFGLEEGIRPAGVEPTPIGDLVTRLRDASSPVDVLIVAEADPVHALPSSWGLREALAGIETTVVLSGFFDDSARQADILLPLNSELERFDAAAPAASIGAPVLSIAEQVVEPLGDGRHPGDIALAIAAALGEPVAGQFPWTSFPRLVEDRIAAELTRLPGGATTTAPAYLRAAVAAGGIFAPGPPTAAPPGPPGETIVAAVASFDGAAPEYPLLLLPFESIKTGDGRGANRPWLQELPDPLSTVMWDSWIELSPPDAEQLGIDDGDRVRVESPVGSVESVVVVDPAVRPGVVGMPMGYGHDDYGRYARGRGANVLELIGGTRVEGVTAPAWSASRVRLVRIGDGRQARFGRSYQDHGAGERIPVGWAPQQEPRGKLG